MRHKRSGFQTNWRRGADAQQQSTQVRRLGVRRVHQAQAQAAIAAVLDPSPASYVIHIGDFGG